MINILKKVIEVTALESYQEGITLGICMGITFYFVLIFIATHLLKR